MRYLIISKSYMFSSYSFISTISTLIYFTVECSEIFLIVENVINKSWVDGLLGAARPWDN